MKSKIILLLFVLYVFCLIYPASAWLSEYDYRMPIEINNTGSNLTNYQYSFIVDTGSLVSDGKMNINGSDCRITNSTDILQYFWNETVFNDSSTKIWVNASILSNTTNTTHYMYYGKSEANSVSDISNTMIFGDEFDTNLESNIQNVASNLSIPTSDGSGQATHPSVLYFDTPWNGYNYWMAMTPYPYEDTTKENPEIIASNDTITWIVPPGQSNPIDPNPSPGYNSDTALIYNNDTDELWCYYRSYVSPDSKILLRRSSNGTTWGSEEIIFSDAGGGSGTHLSPTVVKRGNVWQMWFIKLIDSHYECQYYNSTDGTNWTYNTTIDLDQLGKEPWHLEVQYISEKNQYWMMYNVFGGSRDIVFATSVDGITWTKYNTYILKTNSTGWDSTSLYKSSFRYNQSSDKIELWYSAVSGSNEWNIGYTDIDYTEFIDYINQQWTTDHKGAGTKTNTMDGDLHLSVQNESIGSANIKTTTTFTDNIVVEYRRKADSGNYLVISLGNGVMVDADNGGTVNWWLTSQQNGYQFRVQTNWNDHFISEQATAGFTNIVANESNLISESNYTNSMMVISDEGSNNLRWYIPRDTLVLQGTDTTFLSTEKYIALTQGEYSNGAGGIQDFNWFFVREYASSEPITSFGAEENNITEDILPPNPTSLANTTGNFWVNYTWSPGSGNVTDSYNVSYNGTWDNSSSNAYRNESVGAHGYLNIIVYAYNSSGTGTLSAGYITDNVTIPNNVISITNTSDWSDNEGQNVYVDYDATDVDSDTPTFSCNRTDLFTDFNTATGIGNWQTDYTDAGVYSVNFGVEDGYDSTSNYTMTITVADFGVTGIPTNLQNTTGNFWVNYTWSAGANTDTFNVSINSTWYNGSSQAWANNSTVPHGAIEIVVHGYNLTADQLSSSITDNVTISNNAIGISGVSALYTINEGETLSIDANYTDADGDTGTFDDNSSVWNVDANTGLVSWVTVDGDDGTYNWHINVSDGYGSTITQEFTVKVNDSIYPPTITLVSFSPSPLNTNYTGATVISYMVNSSEPLNLSSLAFLHGVNYTIPAGGDMHNYLSVPANDMSYDGWYKAPNRNVTPYLSWEFNDTITGGNVWQWGGGDNDSSWITKTPINATHTWINVTRMVPESLSNAYFIDSEALYDAPKTGFEINKAQGIILKGWDLDQIRNRNNDYFVSLFFDTSWESTVPTDPIEIGYCNESYDPAVDDIDTCPDCIKFLEWNGTRWVNHSWNPSTNASYASPLVINAQHFTDPSPDDIAYVWLRSNTVSSKSYVLNATDYDPGLTNITFAETESMWTYNEQNGVTTPAAYTPSYFAMYTRDDEDLLHHLYIANDQGVWGHSDIFSEAIGVSTIPVPSVSFEYFNVTCDESYHDEEMDATYDQGTIGVGLHTPADPDGGIVSHNLTLHYYPNQTIVAVINNTFTTIGDEYVEITVDTTPYYSPDTLYTFKCVSTDDEGSIATKWLISYFALDADGNRGWVNDDKLLFWGMNDIPTLYTEVGNSSLISYNGGTDIYTMHVPFFKSKGNDTFYFNETVHLESLNNEDVAYFRHLGRTYFDYANIYAWNTTTDTTAPDTDTYRSYIYSLTMICGNITNSNFSYLGSDFYRQEGLNFVGNSHEYLIHNSTFSHNAEGPIFEESSNFTISNSTISDNVNVGVGIYYSNDIIVENSTISSNGGRSVSVYEGHNNSIRHNDIINSGVHGIHLWSNSQNNTCTGNDITGSTTYDYYLSSSSTDNYLIDPASSTNLIRVTSTSSLNIENTDNAAFSEDSLNTSYAYLTNFSMYVTGVSQTFDITQHNTIITPSTDKLSIWNLEWDDTLTFNASSDTSINPTWFNITNTSWASSIVNVSINGTLVTTENTDANGLLTYNYTDPYSEKWFEFQLYSSIPTATATPTPTATTPPSGGSSSGTGTTGVGTSDEPLYNIDCRETGRIRNLQADIETYYRTTKPDCTDIIKVTFTPTQNSQEQPILIEKLHNRSSFVTTPVPHVTYSNFNLYVGLFGYDEKTNNEKILFKVPINWSTTNNVTPESVTLYIFDPSTTSWKSLPTTLSHTDTLYYVYESESGATYGRFAIVGTDKVSLNIIELITEKIEDIIPSINISESKFITGATSLYNNLKEYIINLLPSSISFDTISDIFDNENSSTYIVAILTLILIAIISYFYNYEHGLIAGLIAIILMIIVTILQDKALIEIMSVEAGNIIISTVAYTTIAFIISYIIGEKLK